MCRSVFAYAGYSTDFELFVRCGALAAPRALVLFLLALLYRYGPCRRTAKWRWVTVGSVFATIVWLARFGRLLLYVSNFANYDRFYGSLGAVIVLLFWLYISFYIVLLGAEINAELELQTAQDTTRGTAKPIGKRGAFVADHVAGGPEGHEAAGQSGDGRSGTAKLAAPNQKPAPKSGQAPQLDLVRRAPEPSSSHQSDATTNSAPSVRADQRDRMRRRPGRDAP